MSKTDNKKLSILNSNFKAILFDMDGVLTDSMADHCRAWIKSYADLYDIHLRNEEVLLREGEKSDKSIREILKEHLNRHPDINEIKKVQNYKSNIFYKPGVLKLYELTEEILNLSISKNFKLALVTGSRKAIIEKDFPLPLNSFFSSIVTSNDVEMGKPNPEPYNKAIKELNLKPSECLTIENAPLGINSAKEAGTYVIALETSLCSKYLNRADLILPDHKALYELIKEI